MPHSMDLMDTSPVRHQARTPAIARDAAPPGAGLAFAPGAPPIVLRPDDLLALSRICLLRLPRRDAETERATRMREVLAAGAQVARAMNAHAHRLLIHCQGSHGAGDPADETLAFIEATARHAALVEAMVRDYAWVLADGQVEGDAPVPHPSVPAAPALAPVRHPAGLQEVR